MKILYFLSLCLATFALEPPAVFPASVRDALAQKASLINPARYTSSGWSNRAGTVLTPVFLDPGVYTGDRPLYWNNIDVGCRMTVIELPSATSDKPDLFVHSPVGLDGPTQKAINDIGNVKYIVSPNYEHLKFACQWYSCYPKAEMWGCPGLSERMPEIKWTGEIPAHCRPNGWKGSDKATESNLPWNTDILQPLHIDIEKNPFTGKPFFNEVIFYHVPSKSLIMTDLFWNYPRDPVPNSQFGRNDSWELAPVVDNIPAGSQLWKFGMDNVYYPFYTNFMVTDKSEFREIANHILNVWDVETIIPAHGDIIRGKSVCRNVLSKHFLSNGK